MKIDKQQLAIDGSSAAAEPLHAGETTAEAPALAAAKWEPRA